MPKETFFLLKSQRGQTFLEFILLMFVLVSMSLLMIKGFNGGVAKRWQAIVKTIASPTDTPIEIP